MNTKKQITIFLVEDNEIYLKTLEKYLKENLKFNVSIHTFLNGEDCLKNMNLKPHIIILDYFLNSTTEDAANGLDILRKIDTAYPEVAVVMLSSQDNIKVATDTMKYGAYDYVSKNDNAFLRVHNIINNINKMIVQADELKINKQIKRVLIVWIILLIGTAVALQLFYPELMSRNN
jgi:DNA-binding NarL/FixJ family response regulator